jgi:hypothetical protein
LWAEKIEQKRSRDEDSGGAFEETTAKEVHGVTENLRGDDDYC